MVIMFGAIGCLVLFASELPPVCEKWLGQPFTGSAGVECGSARLLDENATNVPHSTQYFIIHGLVVNNIV